MFGPRVEQLLAGRRHGLFLRMLEKMYEKAWQEGLPAGWLEAMEAGAGWRLGPAGGGQDRRPGQPGVLPADRGGGGEWRAASMRMGPWCSSQTTATPSW